MNEIAKNVRITGRVQGVWFRGWTQETALDRGVRGWVRNDPDGSVSVLLIGPAEAVNGMLRALHDGPPSAQVRQVEAKDTGVPETPTGFEVRY